MMRKKNKDFIRIRFIKVSGVRYKLPWPAYIKRDWQRGKLDCLAEVLMQLGCKRVDSN